MKSIIRSFLVVAFLLNLAQTSRAEVATVNKVTVAVQPAGGTAYRLLFTFSLPKLPADVNIDYAELSFGVNVTAPLSVNALEILSADSSSQGKTANYNANPVTAFVPKEKTGFNRVDLDMTQLVDSWANGGAKNKGALLVSHRGMAQKVLQTGKVSLAPQFRKAVVRIYYTQTR